MALEHFQHAGGEGGDRRAFFHHTIRLHQSLYAAFTRHGHLQRRQADLRRLRVGDEVQAVDRLADVAERGQADHEDRGAEGYCTQATEHAHATASAVLARLGEVVALEDVQHLADVDQFTGQVAADQVAQGRGFTCAEAVELAADAVVLGLHRGDLEFDVQAQYQAVELELQLAAVEVPDLVRGVFAGEAEAAGRDILQARIYAFALGVSVAQAPRQLDAGVLALGLGLMDDVEIGDGVHGG
ncbi:Uncharacterised protein [Ectopseudomonas mendocina]|nr:Uncharacterised protein [Pseudomonas mendocina]